MQRKAAIQNLYLGRNPPLFTDIRVIAQQADDDHLVWICYFLFFSWFCYQLTIYCYSMVLSRKSFLFLKKNFSFTLEIAGSRIRVEFYVSRRHECNTCSATAEKIRIWHYSKHACNWYACWRKGEDIFVYGLFNLTISTGAVLGIFSYWVLLFMTFIYSFLRVDSFQNYYQEEEV